MSSPHLFEIVSCRADTNRRHVLRPRASFLRLRGSWQYTFSGPLQGRRVRPSDEGPSPSDLRGRPEAAARNTRVVLDRGLKHVVLARREFSQFRVWTLAKSTANVICLGPTR